MLVIIMGKMSLTLKQVYNSHTDKTETSSFTACVLKFSQCHHGMPTFPSGVHVNDEEENDNVLMN